MIYVILFLTFFKIGAFTFGGGYAMLPLIEEEVLNNKWMSLEELVDFIAISESTPGPFAVNISTYIGSEVAGIFGAVCSTLGVVLPSFIIILVVARFYIKFKDNKIVESLMKGLKPAVIGLIGAAIVSIAESVFFPHGMHIGLFGNYFFWSSLIIFFIVLFLEFKKINPILLIFIAAFLGIISGYAEPFIYLVV